MLRLLPAATCTLLAFGLAGCFSIQGVLEPAYIPVPIKIFDQTAFDDDIAICKDFAKNHYKPSMNASALASRTFDGATSNASLIPISPLVPAAGAGGALLSGVADSLYGIGDSRLTVARHCVEDLTRRDGSAIIARPVN